MVDTRVKDYVKYDGHDIESVHVFLSESGGTGKSYLMKVITPYQKHCFIVVKTLRNQEFFFLDLQEYQQI